MIVTFGEQATRAGGVLSARRGVPIHAADDIESLLRILQSATGSGIVVAERGALGADDVLRLLAGIDAGAPDLSVGLLVGTECELVQRVEQLGRATGDGDRAGDHASFDGFGFGLKGAHLRHVDATSLDSLTEPSDVLFLSGHGDGLHVVTQTTGICARGDAAPRRGGDLRVLGCFTGDPCPLERRISAHELGARLVVLSTCWGMYLGGANYALQDTLGDALRRNPRVDAIVTTVRATQLTSAEMQYAYYLVNRGVPAGLLANRLNEFRRAMGRDADFACFGNPDVQTRARLTVRPSDVRGTRITLALSRRSTADDLELHVPAALLPHRPVLVIDGGPVDGGVVDPAGTVFLTVSPTPRECHATLSVYSAQSIDSAQGLIPILDSELPFLDAYLAGLKRLSGATDRLLSESQAALARLRMLLHGWPYRGRGGSVIQRAPLDQAISLLAEAASCAGELFLRVFYENASKRWSPFAPAVWGQVSECVGHTRGVRLCAYCDEPVDEIRYAGRLGRPSDALSREVRVTGYCQGCGFVYDGATGAAARLSGPAVTARGDHLALGVHAPAPFFEFRQDQRVVACLRGIREGSSVVVTATYTQRENDPFGLSIPIPENAAPGRYYVVAAVANAAHLQYLRKPVLVLP